MLRHYAEPDLPRIRFGGKACTVRLAVRDLSSDADLPILGRCEIFAPDPDEAVVMAKGRVDRANS